MTPFFRRAKMENRRASVGKGLTDKKEDLIETMTMRSKQMAARRSFSHLVLLGLTAIGLSACGTSLSESLGYGKEAPDEFAIVTKAPLVIPPDYALRPPRPGAPSPRETSPQAIARAALDQSAQQNGVGQTIGEQALLANAGATNADPNIRQVIDDETRALKLKDEQFMDDVLFWKPAPSEPNRVVDAAGEAQRLRENEALGRPVTEGETPDYDDEEDGGLIDYIFN
jgi:DUF3035 family protein